MGDIFWFHKIRISYGASDAIFCVPEDTMSSEQWLIYHKKHMILFHLTLNGMAVHTYRTAIPSTEQETLLTISFS